MFACAAGGEPACGVYTTVNTATYTAGHAFFAEFAFTTMLCSMVMSVATDARIAGKQPYFGVAIGLVLTCAAMGIGPITGAAINPAVFVGTITSASITVTDMQNMDVCYIYPLAHICAGIVAGGFFSLVYGGPETDGAKVMDDDAGQYTQEIEVEELEDAV